MKTIALVITTFFLALFSAPSYSRYAANTKNTFALSTRQFTSLKIVASGTAKPILQLPHYAPPSVLVKVKKVLRKSRNLISYHIQPTIKPGLKSSLNNSLSPWQRKLNIHVMKQTGNWLRIRMLCWNCFLSGSNYSCVKLLNGFSNGLICVEKTQICQSAICHHYSASLFRLIRQITTFFT